MSLECSRCERDIRGGCACPGADRDADNVPSDRVRAYAESIGKALGCGPVHPGALGARGQRLGLVTWCREHFVGSRDGNSILKGQWTEQGCPVAVDLARAVMAVADRERAEDRAIIKELRSALRSQKATIARVEALRKLGRLMILGAVPGIWISDAWWDAALRGPTPTEDGA